MRIYLPVSLNELFTGETLPAQECLAVTEQWQQLCESDDYDECAEAALDSAALLSWQTGAPLRLAVAADVDDDILSEGVDGVLSCERSVRWEEVASIHIDTPDMLSLCQRARMDEDTYEQLCAEPLSWFDVSERNLVVSLLRPMREQ